MNEAESHFHRGNTLMGQGRTEEAIEAYRVSQRAQPDNPITLYNLGVALHRSNRGVEAIEVYRQSLRFGPDNADAAYNLGRALRDMNRFYEAMEMYRRVLAIQPDFPNANNDMAEIHRGLVEYDQAMECYARELALRPDNALAQSNLFFTLNYHPGYSPEEILRAHRDWGRRHVFPIEPHANDRNPERRLKIGYVSPDFRRHCQAFFTVPLLSHHNHERFEVYCYSNVPREDDITERIRSYADVWRSAVGVKDEELARRIREDRIDILIDLTMHMAMGRPMLFARKPAPIQVAWLAYPGTTGISAMDYRLTDPYLDPPGEHDEWYVEKSVRLADSFWCYDPLEEVAAVQTPPASRNGYVTFGCLNNFCKVTDQTLALWSRVLKKVAGSRLLLLSPEGKHRSRVLSKLDVEHTRVELVDYRPRTNYLELYNRIDLCLDTFPVNGHTTSLDAMWMGVPVVSMEGRAAIARAGVSQSKNLGLAEELVGSGPEEFVSLATGLAGNLTRLGELRASLRGRMIGSVLMDGRRFARNVEAVYRDIWRQYCG